MLWKCTAPSPSLFGTRDSFMEDSFSMDWLGTWFWDDSSTLHLLCTLFLSLLHQIHLRSSDIRCWRLKTTDSGPTYHHNLCPHQSDSFFWTSLRGRDFLCPLQGSSFSSLWQRHSTGLFSGYKCWLFPMFCNTHTYHLEPHVSHSLFLFLFSSSILIEVASLNCFISCLITFSKMDYFCCCFLQSGH